MAQRRFKREQRRSRHRSNFSGLAREQQKQKTGNFLWGLSTTHCTFDCTRTNTVTRCSHQPWKPDIPVPYLYFDMGAAVLCASFMSFGVKRRWFALGAALQLAISTYVAYLGGYVHYGDWLKVRMYSRTVAIIGGFLVLASGAGELYRRKPRSRSLQSTGQVFLGIYLICVAYSLQHSKEDRLAYLNHLPGGELMVQLFFVLYGVLALAFLSGYYVTLAAQILSVLLPPVMLLVEGNVAYWHNTWRVEFWNQMKLLGESVGIFGAAVILATDG